MRVVKYSTRHIDAAIALLDEVESERLTATGRLNLAMAMFCIEEARDCDKPDDMTKLLNTGRGFLNSAVAADDKAKTAKVAEALAKIDEKRARSDKRSGLRTKH